MTDSKTIEFVLKEIKKIKKQIEILSKSNVIEHITDDFELFEKHEIKEIIKPFMKWVGGKTQIIYQVLDSFPAEINNYYEPFVGGGSVLLGLLSYIKLNKIKVYGKIYASDLNSNLIGLYENIQKFPNKLIDEVKNIMNNFKKCKNIEINRNPKNLEEAYSSQESFYYYIRKSFNLLSKEERKSIIGSAMLLFLNKTCFRGVYREGPKGFNVPFGNYKNPSILDESHILLVSDLIKDVIFNVCSYEDCLKLPNKNDFVYLDPPYAPESITSFVSYTSDGFDLDKHNTLFKMIKDIHTKSTKFLMSNSDVKLVNDYFETFKKEVIVCRRAIHSKKPESTTNEVLISNY